DVQAGSPGELLAFKADVAFARPKIRYAPPQSPMLGFRDGTSMRWARLGWTAALVVWFAAVSGGTVALARYNGTPGAAAGPRERWPVASAAGHEAGKPALLMLAHPRCPCTRASLAELSVVMARLGERVTATVLFLRPEGADDDWNKGELWNTAAAIPGVRV